MNKEKVIEWLNELADKNPEEFGEYFYDDIRNFIINQEPKSTKLNTLFKCKTKKEVKQWLDDVSGYIIMQQDIDVLLEDYFY
jgi:hypothetical protein